MCHNHPGLFSATCKGARSARCLLMGGIVVILALASPSLLLAYGGGPHPLKPVKKRVGASGILRLLGTSFRVRLSSIVVRPSARASAMRRHVQSLMRALRKCPGGNGPFWVTVRLHRRGKVTVRRRRSTLSSGAEKCLMRVLRRRWPAGSRGTRVELKLRLSSSPFGGLGRAGVGFGGLIGVAGVRAHGMRPRRVARAVASPFGRLITSGLSRAVVQRVVRRHLNQVKACYQRALVFRADLKGRVTVRISISSTGHVKKAQVISSTIDKAGGVGACVVKRIRGWRFPAPSGGQTVSVVYPFIFKR